MSSRQPEVAVAETLWIKGKLPDGYRAVAERKGPGKQARKNVPRSSRVPVSDVFRGRMSSSSWLYGSA